MARVQPLQEVLNPLIIWWWLSDASQHQLRRKGKLSEASHPLLAYCHRHSSTLSEQLRYSAQWNWVMFMDNLDPEESQTASSANILGSSQTQKAAPWWAAFPKSVMLRTVVRHIGELLCFGESIKPVFWAFVEMRDPLGFSQKDCNALRPHPTLIKLNGKNLNHFCGNWMFARLAQIPSEIITSFQQFPLQNFSVPPHQRSQSSTLLII